MADQKTDIWRPFAETLPTDLGPPELPGAPTDGVTPRRQPSLLLVDDDPFMLGMQSRMLRSMGYTMIGTAGSADAAMQLLGQGQDKAAVDVVICDLNMPDVDGLEFLRRLGDSDFRGNVVLLSGEGPRIIHAVRKLLEGLPLLILGALEKPAGRSALRALLDRWQPMRQPAAATARASYSALDLQVAQQAQQWVLHYQPKVDLHTGALTGVEALVRWNHPLRGLVYPDQFIGVAEDCAAIGPLTDWVLRTALAQLACWHDEGLQIHMAVNVSMENLRCPDFARKVAAMVHHSSLSPQDLVLEVTESRVMAVAPAPLETLVRLRMQRFGLSIDDFGTGHSSLAQLRDVPFTELKIDRGFVHGARHNQLIRPMLEGSIGMAQRLGLQAVAEGVETEDDWRLLREIGCDIAQGYFIGRPMPGEGLQAWLVDWLLKRPRLTAL